MWLCKRNKIGDSGRLNPPTFRVVRPEVYCSRRSQLSSNIYISKSGRKLGKISRDICLVITVLSRDLFEVSYDVSSLYISLLFQLGPGLLWTPVGCCHWSTTLSNHTRCWNQLQDWRHLCTPIIGSNVHGAGPQLKKKCLFVCLFSVMFPIFFERRSGRSHNSCSCGSVSLHRIVQYGE
jgi:hypothetical protein